MTGGRSRETAQDNTRVLRRTRLTEEASRGGDGGGEGEGEEGGGGADG